MIIREYVLSAVAPAVLHGLYELPRTSPEHALYQVSAISFLMGRGFDFPTAHHIVESWEDGEAFPPFQGDPGEPYPYGTAQHPF
ncbi:hypothetical protein [Paenibacillus xerothermodurans]|uniref:Uncharacterized protein n=1 Tax=Paenibacillus xerothermodurans TaxID=1977292 RepID=A0A2W1NFR1_PAEXE|nr:hypothetical protein [Paenibacillus xerothermodurans]PZE22834.1 hypothetical protein CBW46_003500 [Paenibacillus xerothermodurans]